MRTTTSSGSFLPAMSEPSRSLNRRPQVSQYSRRRALFLPIRSAIERFPALNLLKSAQLGFWQAKNESGNSAGTGALFDDKRFLAMGELPAEMNYLSDNSSTKSLFGLENQRFYVPIL